MGELEADREVLVSARLSPGWRLQLSVTFAEGPDYNIFFDLVDLTDFHTLISPLSHLSLQSSHRYIPLSHWNFRNDYIYIVGSNCGSSAISLFSQ